jgi:uncharacterized protein (DUF4415 family)
MRKVRKRSAKPSAKELRELSAKNDRDIDTSDIPEITDWSGAEVGRFYRPIKKSVTMRLDADVIAWFKAHSERYQTAVNKVLRDYIRARR